MWWRHTAAAWLGVSFGIYRRCCRDVLMGCQLYAPLRHLGDVPLRDYLVFHLRLACDVTQIHWLELIAKLSWNVVITFQYDVVETYHWDILLNFHRDITGCFIWDLPAILLGPTERRYYDVTMTSCCQMRSFLGRCGSTLGTIV